MSKSDATLEDLIHQKGFTHSTTAIYRHKLRHIAGIQAIQLLDFLFTSYQFHLKIAFYRATKVQKIPFVDK